MLSENLTTQANRTLKIWWPEYLECVVIEGSLEKVGMERTKQWNYVFEKVRWDGTYNDSVPTVLDELARFMD